MRLATTTSSRTEWVLSDAAFKNASDRIGDIYCLTAEVGNLGGLIAVARRKAYGMNPIQL